MLKMPVISLLPEELLAYEEGLCSVEVTLSGEENKS
jgi:hypothetical protein